MNNLNNLTVIIVTYLTQKKILINCLKSINKDIKIKIMKIPQALNLKKK